MTYCHPLCAMSIGPPKFDHEHLWSRSCVRSKVKVTFDLQNSKVKIMVKLKHIGHIWGLAFNRYVCFLFCGNRTTLGWGNSIFDLENSRSTSWPRSNPMAHLSPRIQSMCLLFVLWQSDHFWLRYSKFYIWPWKFKVKVMAKVKPDGPIWALELNRYACFSFRGNQTILGWDIANSKFDLEKSRSRSRRKWTKI